MFIILIDGQKPKNMEISLNVSFLGILQLKLSQMYTEVYKMFRCISYNSY